MNRTDEKKPTGSSNSTVGSTDTTIIPDTSGTNKSYAAQASRAASAGDALTRINPMDRRAVDFAANADEIRALSNLAAAVQLLVRTGGVQ